MNFFDNFTEAFTEWGVPEAIAVMGEISSAIFDTFLPEEVLFHRRGSGNRIADGSPCCVFAFHNLIS